MVLGVVASQLPSRFPSGRASLSGLVEILQGNHGQHDHRRSTTIIAVSRVGRHQIAPYYWTSGCLKRANNDECSFLGEIQELKSGPVLIQIDAVRCFTPEQVNKHHALAGETLGRVSSQLSPSHSQSSRISILLPSQTGTPCPASAR